MNPRITLPGSIERRLKTWLGGHPLGHERGAIVLFRKFDRPLEGLKHSPRFVAVDVVLMDEDWILNSSPIHLKINLRKLPPLYLRCEQEQLDLGFVHSHPVGAEFFSATDDRNEQNILKGYAGCNGDAVTLVSLVLSGTNWIGRTRNAAVPEVAEPIRHLIVLSDRIELHLPRDTGGAVASELLLRQEAAFGKPFNRKMQSLRIVVVGGGGTGSPTATLLARSGTGELTLADGDSLAESNLNRVRGYRKADVGDKKVVALKRYIDSLGLNCDVAALPGFIGAEPAVLDAIASADVVFGCTDDVAGRDLMNQALFYYCVAYIDVGLTGRIGTDDDGMPYLLDHRGRVSTILPEHGACLRCQGVVTEAKLEFEQAIKERPELRDLDPETLRREYYLTGGQESAPGIGPFTSMVGDMAVATLMNLIKPYRKTGDDLRHDNLWIDFIHLNIYSNMPKANSDCFCCGEPGLLNAAEGSYRLGMPALGRVPSP